MLVRFLQGGDLEVKNQHGTHVKPVAEGTTYPVQKVVYSFKRDFCDIYWEEGCSESVPAEIVELHGPIDSVSYKKEEKSARPTA